MTKREGNVREDTEASDLEAFEEWEEGEKPAEGQGAIPADELDFSAFEEQPAEAPPAAAPSHAGEALPAPVDEPTPVKPVAYEMAESLLELAPDVPVNLVAVIGKTTTTVGELIKYRLGHVVELGRPPGESVDLVANGRLIARGELVDIDGQLGVRILKMVK
ncbi:MAG: FliM/FliN family flagellar motor switch protein [bacterium]